MTEVGVRELKQRASELLRRVREGRETIDITYRGKVVAQLTPAESPEDRRARGRRVLADIETLSQEIAKVWPKGVSAVEAVREQRREL